MSACVAVRLQQRSVPLMSGLEILGAFAAAAQLADAAIEIIQLISTFCKKVINAPRSIKARTIQVQQLIDIAQLIKRTPPLQTALIGSILKNCVKEAEDLRDVLSKLTVESDAVRVEKYWKAVVGVAKEKRILGILEKLEEERNALTLCIVSINSSVTRAQVLTTC
jgi:hypothetical protein